MLHFEKIAHETFRVPGRTHGYVLRRGSEALVVDPGPGEWVMHFGEIGVRKIAGVLATHHHRDTLANAAMLVQGGAPLAAPASETDRIAGASEFWKTARTTYLYDCDSDFYSLRESVPVAHALADGQTLELGGFALKALELAGHTKGSMAYVIEHGGTRLAFAGDNIAAPGAVHDLHDFQYSYMGFNEGTTALLERLPRLIDARPGLLLPAHGDPIADPAAALEQLRANLQRHVAAVAPNRLPRPKDELRKISEHVWFVGGTTYAVVAPSGKALFWDLGYVDTGRMEEFYKQSGASGFGLVTFSHYHDDHICRALEFAGRHHALGTRHPDGTQLWCHRTLHAVLTDPLAWRLPCIWPAPLPIARVYGDETIAWEGLELDLFEFPGQAFYHAGLVVAVDGRRYAFTGDNIWKRADESKPITGPIIARNRYFVDRGYEFSAQRLIERKIDFICPAHGDAFPVSAQDLEGFKAWAKETREAIQSLCPSAPLGMDPWWLRIDPFHLRCGKRPVEMRVKIESPFAKSAKLRLRPVSSEAPSFVPEEAEVTVAARGLGEVAFMIVAREDFAPGTRIPVTIELHVDGEAWGEFGEALLAAQPSV